VAYPSVTECNEVDAVGTLPGSKALVLLFWRADSRLLCGLAVLAIVLGVLPNATVLATGWLVGSVPDAVEHGLGSDGGRRALLALGLLTSGFFASGIGLALARLGCEVMNTRFAGEVARTAARACARPRGIAALEDPDVVGDLTALEELERSGVHMQAAWSLRIITSMRIAGLGAAVLLLWFEWWAPLVLAAGWYVANHGTSRWMERGFTAARAEGGGRLRRADYLRSLATGASASKELRVFGLSGWVCAEYARTWWESMSAIWRTRRTHLPSLVLGTGALTVSHAAVFGALGWQASRGGLSIGELTVYGLATLGTSELGFLGDHQWRIGRAAALARQLLDLEERLDGRAPTPRAPARTRPVADTATSRSAGPARLSLEGVRFHYPVPGRPGDTAPVLAGLDLSIPAGQSVAVVGANGVGKTTLIKLVCGLYEPVEGCVRLDGQDLRSVGTDDLRRRVGVIFSNFVRYELPLRHNVGFGSLDLLEDTATLERSLRSAGGGDLLTDLPAGWDTVLSSGYAGGVDLSGGQWQKVALARALTAVRGGAGVLLLDEPTANLDVRAEAELFDRFLELTRDTTTILVSHRMSSVRHADRIVVLADGKVAEDGSHDELLTAGGRYATMFRLQARRFDEHASVARAEGA
jgi:ATP-binding cassette, subfamily B, bacterial